MTSPTRSEAVADSAGEGHAQGERNRLSRLARAVFQVLWPSFLGAAMAVGVFFSAIDPLEIEFVGVHLADSREGAYTVGFFLFWMLFALSGAIIWYLAATDHDRG